MFKFRVLNNDNRTNSIYVQGARSDDTSNDIASIIFQNFDNDTNATYDMASIAIRDQYGSSNFNGVGNMIFRTNIDGSNLDEHMRITYDGHVLIGTTIPQEKLTVDGNVFITSNLYASNISMYNISICNLVTSTINSINSNLIIYPETIYTSNSIFLSNIISSNDLYVNNYTYTSNLIVNNIGTFCNNINCYSNLTVFKETTLCNNTNIYGTLNLYKDAIFNSNTTLCNATNIYGILSQYNNVVFYSNVDIASNLLVKQQSTLCNNVDIYGSLSCYSNINVYSQLISKSNIITSAQFLSSSSDTSNFPGFSWSNNSNIGLYNPIDNVIGIVTTGIDRMRILSDGRISIGNSNARELLEVYKGNILSKNLTRLVKTLNSLSNIDITINWENNIATNQYYLIIETTQQVANATQVGTKNQKHLINIFDAGNYTSPTITFSQTANTFGNNIPVTSLSINSVYVNATSLTIRSSSSWNTIGSLTHSFTVDVIQVPDIFEIGFTWLV